MALEPQPETHNHPTETSQQPGPAKRRFRRDVTPQSGPTMKTVCFSFNEGPCIRHPKPCDRLHKCIRCGGDHKMIECKATIVQSS